MRKIIETLLLLGASFLVTSCGVIKKTENPTANSVVEVIKESYPQDNIVEEMVEAKIQSVTGLDIDLSPSSPEK